MNREIKFRAWDKQDKKMSTPFDISEINNNQTGYYAQTPDGYFELGNAILMQFTGAVDRLGKEVYEGDIAHVIWTEGGVERTDHEYKILIEFYNESGAWSFTPFFFSNELAKGHPESGDKTEIEIIGNIYENPELKKQL